MVEFVPDVNPASFVFSGSDVLGVMVPSKIDPALAPAGYSCITLVKFLPHELAVTWDRNAPGYAARKHDFGGELIAMAERAIP